MLDSEFLDTQQYTEAGIRDYEAVWGEGFVSPGGAEKARELIASLALPAGSRVLDVCCGLGGSAFMMAEEFGLQVDYADLAQSRCREKGLQERVRIELGDCLELEGERIYDAVYSRDAFLHIANKARLLAGLYRLLKPGGQLLLTDYACAAKPWSETFRDYVSSRGYALHTVEEYAALVREAGFVEVEGEDLTEEFGQRLRADLETISSRQVTALETSFQAKLRRAREGEQRWCRISARRPSQADGG